ncbi:metallophosphoesterase [Arenimonas daejeonensis]|uniref:metallophosphoesterase n=1 Tax=Arenimonas daejeonensis TaxID=370777 RepID=UPI0011BE84A2|nr:metallophosphoesterase [Arenimonas daejeonensis]
MTIRDAGFAPSSLRLRPLAAIALLALLAGCAGTGGGQVAGPEAEPPAQPFSLVLFGDHGYHLDYMDPEDIDPPRTLEQAIALEREEWLEDKRPPDDFTPSSLVRLPATGGYVAATGITLVADAMEAYCRSEGCDAGAMLGDNIYPDGPTGGADGRDDGKRFDDILLAPYRNFVTLGEDFRIYATLGNHDWRTSREAAMAEVDYLSKTRPFYMDGIFYRVKPPAGRGEVELFVIDTEVMLAGTTVYEAELADDGSELPPHEIDEPKPWAKPQNEAERGMAAWLERSLRDSDARWKIVVGHHPLWSSSGSKFEQARVLRRIILPSLCRYADMYVAGHEHTVELHSDSCAAAVPGEALPPLPQIVSGAAAKHRPLNTWFMAHQARANPELTTHYAEGLIWGYVHLRLDGDQAVAKAITTPNDGSGGNVVAHTQVYARRSGQLP